MSICYSNRKRDISHTQNAEGQQASGAFISRNWHSHSSWRLTLRSINPQHTDASTNPTLSVPITLRDNVGYENKMCQEVLPLLNAQCFVMRAHLRKSSPVKVELSS